VVSNVVATSPNSAQPRPSIARPDAPTVDNGARRRPHVCEVMADDGRMDTSEDET
jgi:hypothetical protein